jgi:hypothetical protein
MDDKDVANKNKDALLKLWDAREITKEEFKLYKQILDERPLASHFEEVSRTLLGAKSVKWRGKHRENVYIKSFSEFEQYGTLDRELFKAGKYVLMDSKYDLKDVPLFEMAVLKYYNGLPDKRKDACSVRRIGSKYSNLINQKQQRIRASCTKELIGHNISFYNRLPYDFKCVIIAEMLSFNINVSYNVRASFTKNLIRFCDDPFVNEVLYVKASIETRKAFINSYKTGEVLPKRSALELADIFVKEGKKHFDNIMEHAVKSR